MPGEELDRTEAHRKAQWLAYQKHLAEVEELRALDQACEQAVQQVLRMRAALLDARLDRQRAELFWQAVHVARGAELLDSFRNDLRTIIDDFTDPLYIIRRIREKLKLSPCEAIDWTTFDVEFQSAYPEFQSKLIARHPELTGIELKACTLLKLQLASSDIATLLCISDRAIARHRTHIRRKMGLVRGEDLYKILAGI